MREIGGRGHEEDSTTKTIAATTSISTRSAVLVFALACCIRIFHAAVMVHSYFDPDEFWQTMEPAYCLVFYNEAAKNSDIHFTCPGFTWEWKRRPTPNGVQDANLIQASLWGPARTHLSVLPVYLFYRLLKYFSWDSTWMVERGPMVLYAVTVAAPTDWIVWYIAHYLQTPSPSPIQPRAKATGEKRNTVMTSTAHNYFNNSSSLPAWCLFCSLSSWFNAYSMVRTFANAQETALFMFAVALVSPELLLWHSSSTRGTKNSGTKDDESAGCCKSTNAATRSLCRACWAFCLGGLCVSIRSTAIAAFVPMGILLALHHSSSSSSSSSSWWPACYSFVRYLLFPCATFGVAGIVCAMGVDWYFFGIWTMPFLGNFHFNAVLDHAALYGSHPWHWYFGAGIPVVAGLWLPVLLVDIMDYWKRHLLFIQNDGTTSRRQDVGRRNLAILAGTYVFILSANAHKEFRYILPVLPLFCLLAGERVRLWFLWMTGGGGRDGRDGIHRGRIFILGTIVVIIQLAVVAYLGRFHQSGSISVNRRIVQDVGLHQNFLLYLDPVDEVPSFSIHYLTGACHSTPLLSQLHIPIASASTSSFMAPSSTTKQQHVRFDTWSLDCSPDCRADPNAVCEYQRFDLDPVSFIKEAYESSGHQQQRPVEEGGSGSGMRDLVCENESSDEDTMTCRIAQQQQQEHRRRRIPPPDYLVTTSSYLNRIGTDLLNDGYGLEILDQFPQRIQGIRLAGRYMLLDESGNSFAPSFHSIYTLRLPLGQNQYITLLEVRVEDMIVLHQRKPQKVAITP